MHRYLPLILTLLSFRCSVIEAAPVRYVVVTSEVPIVAQASTIQPAQKIDPAAALAEAREWVLLGYYENAAEIYNELLEQPKAVLSLEQRADAAFALGQVGNQMGQYVIARTALSLFIAEFPTDARIAQAHYLRGKAASALELWKLAIADYERYLAAGSSVLASFVWEKIADARLALNEREQAIEFYHLALQHHRSLIPQLILREKLARLHWEAGEYLLAVQQYDEILSVARNAPYRAEMEYLAASATLENGLFDDGIERLRKITLEYPETYHAYLAIVALNQNGIEIPGETRARISFHSGDYASALNALEQITSGQTITAEQYLMIGRSQRELGDFPNAQLTFQIMAAVHPHSQWLGQALLEQGRTHFLAGNIDTAIKRYLSIADDYPNLASAAPEALWRAGYLYGTSGKTAASLQVFLRLHQMYPNSEQAESGLALAAAAAVKSGDLDNAAEIFSSLTEASNAELRAEAWLWLGKHPSLSGRDPHLAWSMAATASPDGYFAARSTDLAAEREPFSKPLGYVFTFHVESEREKAEKWLRERWDLTQSGALWPLSDPLKNDLRYLRGNELWALGEFAAAQDEFLALVNANGGDPLKSYQLAVALSEKTVYYPSLVAAAQLIRLAGVSTLEAPPYIARLRYPIYYLQPVLTATDQRGIDPLLMFALIRQESLFDANATAAAGEKGLTQVIPSTGDYIAGRLAWADYEHSDLFRPYASIEFGTYYLAEQLDAFEQNAFAALAGYNAGPGRAADWLALAGDDPEAFITTITIDSTRKYVQNIYAQHFIYRSLYGEN